MKSCSGFWSSCCGSVVTNPTRIHEDSCSIPDPTQWVKDSALLCRWCRSAAAAPIQSLAWELSYCQGCGPKPKNQNTKQTKKTIMDFKDRWMLWGHFERVTVCNYTFPQDFLCDIISRMKNNLFFNGHTHGIWRFPGQGVNLSHPSNLCCSCGTRINTGRKLFSL